jgi:prepilin-type N-terminal cleavage/methylation domain-containing protein
MKDHRNLHWKCITYHYAIANSLAIILLILFFSGTTMPRSKNLGFTLIELMMVVAIISLLIVVGMPAYEKYKIQANISDGISVLSEYKKSMVILWNTDSKLPSDNTVLPGGPVDLPFNKTVANDLSNNIESLILFKVSDGVAVNLVFSSTVFPNTPANNRSITLGAKIKNGAVEFECGNFSTDAQSSADIGLLDMGILPKECQYNGISSWITNPNV